MAIKVMFPPDKESITVTGLYQWDYGQQLEIDAEGLPECIQVHFSCTSMTEAVVRDCLRDENGVYTVSIPDECLEQASPITAWVYDWSVISGKTVKVITLPVIARPRPSITRGASADEEDHFANLITQLNQAIADLKNGNIVVKNAENAATATTVTGFTGTVSEALQAKQAEVAQKDYQGNVIHITYAKKEQKLYTKTIGGNKITKGTLVEIGDLPAGKTENDIVSIGCNVGITANTFTGTLNFSACKACKSVRNPTTGRYEVPFTLNASLVSGENAFGVTNMDVAVYSDKGKLYLYFENGSYSWYVIGSASCDVESLSGGNFKLNYVSYCFA